MLQLLKLTNILTENQLVASSWLELEGLCLLEANSPLDPEYFAEPICEVHIRSCALSNVESTSDEMTPFLRCLFLFGGLRQRYIACLHLDKAASSIARSELMHHAIPFVQEGKVQ